MFLVLAFSATAFGQGCRLPPGQSAPPACCGGDDCCTVDNLCGVGEGDCDTDADCKGNLTCGKDNCPANDNKYDGTDDCCEDLTVCPAKDPVKGAQCGKADLACNSTETDVCGNPLCQFICSDNTMKWEEVCFGELACDPSVCLAKDPIKGASCGKADLVCNSTETDLCGNPLCQFSCNNNTMEWDEVCFGACDPTVCPATDPVDGAKCGKADLICFSKTGPTCCGQPLCFFNCDDDTMLWEERCLGDCDPSNCAKTCMDPQGQPTGATCCGGDDCCTPDNQCGVSEGDCDTDNDCQGNLTCGKNNCPANDDNYDGTDDCCEDLTVCPTTDPVKGAQCGKADLVCDSTETDVCGNPLCQFICSDNTMKWEEVCFGELACDP